MGESRRLPTCGSLPLVRFKLSGSPFGREHADSGDEGAVPVLSVLQSVSRTFSLCAWGVEG